MAYEKQFETLEQLNQAANFNGGYAVVTGDQTLFERVTGFADLNPQKPFTATTSSALGSGSKQFTAAAILKLEREGRLDLEAPLSTYLPEYQQAGKVTLRQLLNMDAGVPDYTAILAPELMAKEKAAGFSDAEAAVNANNALGEDVAYEEVLKLINDKPLDFEPGSQFAYSNTNYLLLSHLITLVSHQSFSDYLSEQVFQPLGMQGAKVGTQYSEANAFTQFGDHDYRPSGRGSHLAGDGGIVLNLEDYKKWAQAIINQQLEGFDASLKLQHDDAYGMGWMKAGNWYWHSGHILSYWSDIYLSPRRQVASVFLHNITTPDLKAEMAWMDIVKNWHTQFEEEL